MFASFIRYVAVEAGSRITIAMDPSPLPLGRLWRISEKAGRIKIANSRCGFEQKIEMDVVSVTNGLDCSHVALASDRYYNIQLVYSIEWS